MKDIETALKYVRTVKKSKGQKWQTDFKSHWTNKLGSISRVGEASSSGKHPTPIQEADDGDAPESLHTVDIDYGLVKKLTEQGLVRFSSTMLQEATSNFKDNLGKGGFSDVFKGKLQDGRMWWQSRG
eukprot:TRINITY_DN3489_c0_g1_i12.p1 TRINITY_DN3489_c0_g1~~TRINITY_DN3489_c0_g1_i12.p1  ORF type:complete len:137 (+),score=20.12 TRINITY_DN3489_c0_g1_i12:33-413(+)